MTDKSNLNKAFVYTLTLNTKLKETFQASKKQAIYSFFSALVVFPFFFVGKFLTDAKPNKEITQIQPESLDIRVYLIIFLSYVLSWLVWPVFMSYVSITLKKTKEFFSYICLYNWLRLSDIIIILTFSLYEKTQTEIFAKTSMILSLLIVVYQWFLARNAFKATRFGAFNMMFVDLLFRLMIAMITATTIKKYLPEI